LGESCSPDQTIHGSCTMGRKNPLAQIEKKKLSKPSPAKLGRGGNTGMAVRTERVEGESCFFNRIKEQGKGKKRFFHNKKNHQKQKTKKKTHTKKKKKKQKSTSPPPTSQKKTQKTPPPTPHHTTQPPTTPAGVFLPTRA